MTTCDILGFRCGLGHTDSVKATKLLTTSTPSLLGREQVSPPEIFNMPASLALIREHQNSLASYMILHISRFNCVDVCVLCVCLVPLSSEESATVPGTGMMDGYELTRECWEVTPGPQQEQQVTLSAEPSPQPQLSALPKRVHESAVTSEISFQGTHMVLPLQKELFLLFK